MHKVRDQIARYLFEENEITFAEALRLSGSYKAVIALDVGGGNCSAAWAVVDDGGMGETQLLRVNKLRGGDPYSCWSVIGYDTDGMIKIGKAAQMCQRRYSNYKCVPTDQNLKTAIRAENDAGSESYRSRKELLVDYIRALYKNIWGQNEVLKGYNSSDVLVLVGHPDSADWKAKEARTNLEAIVKEATGVGDVLTMSESNAAIVYALNLWHDIGRMEKIAIIDLGAYSADITYIDKTVLQSGAAHRDASVRLGGGQVDLLLAKIAAASSGTNVDPKSLLFDIRAIKEKFWPEGTKEQEIYVKEMSCSIKPGDLNRAVAAQVFETDTIDSNQSHTASYTEHLKKFLADAGAELKIGNVDCVLITGGAARMTPAADAIRAYAREVWGAEKVYPDEINDKLIDEAVPCGMLQYYAKALAVLKVVPALEDRLKEASEGLCDGIARKAAEKLYPYLMNQILLPKAEAWAAEKGKKTGRDLLGMVMPIMEQQEHKDTLDEKGKSAAAAAAAAKKADFQKIISEVMNELYHTDANRARWELPDVQFPVDTLTGTVKKVVSSLCGNISDWVIMIIWPLVLVWAIIATIFDIDTKDSLDLELGQGRRNRIIKELKKANARKDIEDQTYEELKKKLHDRWIEDAFGVPKAYLEALALSIGRSVYAGF